MEHLLEPYEYIGETVNVVPEKDDDFLCEFTGKVVGVRGGFLQVRDQEDKVFEVEIKQVTVTKAVPVVRKQPVCPHCGEVGGIAEIDRVAVLVPVQTVTADGTLDFTGESEVDWEFQSPRNNPPKFQCRDCGEECTGEQLIAATWGNKEKKPDEAQQG